MRLILLLLLHSSIIYAQETSRVCRNTGIQHIYHYKLEGVSYSDIEKLYSNDTSTKRVHFLDSKTIRTLNLSIEFKIRMMLLSCSKNKRFFSVEVFDPVFVNQNTGMVADFELMKQDIIKPFFITRTSTGKVVSIQADESIAYPSLNMIKEIVGRLQFVTDPKHQNIWESREESTAGSYLAEYKKISEEPSYTEYSKINLGFIKINSAQPNQKIDIDSKATFKIDSLSTVIQMSLSEAMVTKFGTDTVSAYGCKVNILHLDKFFAGIAKQKDLIAIANSLPYKKRQNLSTALSDSEINRLVYTNTIGKDNFETLELQLRDSDSSSLNKLEGLILKFRALAYLYPEECVKMGVILREAPFGSIPFKVISQALAFAETNTAINALVSVIRSRSKEPSVVISLLSYLTTTKVPTRLAISYAKKLSFEKGYDQRISSTAQLALGGLANSLYKIDLTSANQLTKYLLKHLRSIPDTLQRILVMGNTGSPLALPFFKSILLSETVSTHIMIAAIEVLRFITNDEANALLRNFESKSDEAIVKAAKESLQYQARSKAK